MSNRIISARRFGTISPEKFTVSQAVAASAAYPPALPAFDWQLDFDTKEDGTVTKRVLVTDGGVYENLGVSSIEYRAGAFC